MDAISDICISMKAEDYLELPDFIQHEVPVLLDAKARRAYDQFERDLLLEVDEDVITAASAAVLVGKLLQMCNGAVYSNDGHIVPVHDCKLEAYLELLEQLNGEHCLTFYGYQHDRDRILEALKKHRKDLRVRVYKPWRMRRPGTTERLMCCWCIRPPVPTASTSRQAASMWCGTASTGPLS